MVFWNCQQVTLNLTTSLVNTFGLHLVRSLMKKRVLSSQHQALNSLILSAARSSFIKSCKQRPQVRSLSQALRLLRWLHKFKSMINLPLRVLTSTIWTSFGSPNLTQAYKFWSFAKTMSILTLWRTSAYPVILAKVHTNCLHQSARVVDSFTKRASILPKLNFRCHLQPLLKFVPIQSKSMRLKRKLWLCKFNRRKIDKPN